MIFREFWFNSNSGCHLLKHYQQNAELFHIQSRHLKLKNMFLVESLFSEGTDVLNRVLIEHAPSTNGHCAYQDNFTHKFYNIKIHFECRKATQHQLTVLTVQEI